MKAKRILACILSAAMLISMFAATSIPSVSAVISESDLLLDLDFSDYNGEATLTDKTGNLTVDMTGIEVGEGREDGTKAAQLDGTDAIRWRGDDYDPFALTDTGFTLSVWYNIAEYKEWTQWFAYGRRQDYGMICQYSGTAAANPKLSYGTHPQMKESTGYPGINTWAMVTVKQDYSTKLLSVYVNGQLIQASVWNYTMKDVATYTEDGASYNASYNLGAPIDRNNCWDYWSGDGKLNGLIGSCAIYGRALTDSEIAKLYDSTYVEPEQPSVSSGLLLDLDFSAYNGEASLADKTGNLTVDMTGVEIGEGREDGTASAKLNGETAIRWRGEDYDPFIHTDTGMTINMWLSVDSFKEWSQYFSYGRVAGYGLVMQYSTAHAVHYSMVYGSKATDDGDNAYPGTGSWMMVTMTQDYATNSLSLYVNGERKLVREMPADMKDVATFGSYNAQYNIGAPVSIFDQWSSDGKLNGRVASFQIYGSAKTEEEVAELFNPTPAIDQEAIDNVISLIDEIGEVSATAESLAKIVAAEEAYAALTAEEQALVTNHATLTAAREAYNNLMAQPADYSELNALIATVPTDFSAYTTASAEAFQAFYADFQPDMTLTVADQATVDGYVAMLKAELAKLMLKNVEMKIDIAAGMVTPAAANGKYDITWNASILIGEDTTLELINENATFINYGVYYATSEEEVQKLISGEETLLARQIEFGNNSEDELIVYTAYGFRLKNVASERVRTAVFYLTYECDGVQYTICSAANTASTPALGE